MDINPTRVSSLLKEALTQQPVPSARADPATAALVKALVQPPAPSTVQAAQFTAQTLNGSLPRPAAQPSQRLSSAEIEDAYRAVMEPDGDAEGAAARAPAGRTAAQPEQPARAAIEASQPTHDNAAGAAVPFQTPSSAAAAALAPALVAANTNAPQPRGVAARPPGHAPRTEPAPTSLWAISIVTAIVSAVTTTIVVLLLR